MRAQLSLLCASSCIQLRITPIQLHELRATPNQLCHSLAPAAAARPPRLRMQAQPPPPPSEVPLPAWVAHVNGALETSATNTLLAFVALDLAGAAAILCALCALRVPVGADFALALALTKVPACQQYVRL